MSGVHIRHKTIRHKNGKPELSVFYEDPIVKEKCLFINPEKRKFRCNTCGQKGLSYKELGAHSASHKGKTTYNAGTASDGDMYAVVEMHMALNDRGGGGGGEKRARSEENEGIGPNPKKGMRHATDDDKDRGNNNDNDRGNNNDIDSENENVRIKSRCQMASLKQEVAENMLLWHTKVEQPYVEQPKVEQVEQYSVTRKEEEEEVKSSQVFKKEEEEEEERVEIKVEIIEID